jgi:hypothetical protein
MDLRRYPDAMRFSSNGYFFLFLAAFFAFSAMLPSVVPKSSFSASRQSKMPEFRLRNNCKIDTLRFEEGKRPSGHRDLRPDEVLA